MQNFWQKLPVPFLILAPMENVTDVVFREIVATLLPPPQVFFTEFTNTDALCSKGKPKAIKKLAFTPNQHPIVAQIWGTTPEHYHTSAQLVRELGFDGVDINMGCPDKKVLKIGAGSAHCLDQNRAAEVITAVKDGAGDMPVSVKTRLGYNKIITDEWIPFLLQQDIAALTIHGRVAKQMSTGDANWDEIGKAVTYRNQIAPHTKIIGNGDVLSYSQAVAMHQAHKVDGVMIARGIFSNPWVFEPTEHIKERQPEEYLKILLVHVRLHDKTWGQTKRFEIMKKFFKMYVRDFPGASELRQKLMECDTVAEVEAVIKTEVEITTETTVTRAH